MASHGPSIWRKLEVGVTFKEQDALEWDAMQERGLPELIPARRTKLWSYYLATMADWLRIADYANGQGYHNASADAFDGKDYAKRCFRVEERIKAVIAKAEGRKP
jgi:hypothetical protein